jgi:hypothetical protein
MTDTRPSVRKRLPERVGEWSCSGVILLIGVGLFYAPGTLGRQGLSSFASWAPPFGWSGFALLLAAERIISLFINGHGARGSAPLRLLGSIVGASFFGAFLGRFLSVSTPDAPAFGVYFSTTFLLLEMWNATRAMKDTLQAWELRF